MVSLKISRLSRLALHSVSACSLARDSLTALRQTRRMGDTSHEEMPYVWWFAPIAWQARFTVSLPLPPLRHDVHERLGMTRKHFIRAAEIVRSYVKYGLLRDGQLLGNSFEVLFSEFNPRFDARRFRVACGLAEAPIKVSKRKPVGA
jgi:hypothetical protein